MSSLYPGLLFSSTGLNRKLTPVTQRGISLESKTKLERVPFKDPPCPKSSPVSAVYDVCNTSTCLIILNNRFSRRSKGSRLRGQTYIKGDIVKPEPERHTAQNPARKKCQYHQQCFMSDPEESVTTARGGITPSPAGIRRSQDYSLKLNNGSSVNPHHHINCQGSTRTDITEKSKTHQHSQIRASFRENITLSEILNGGSLTQGGKFYLNSIIKVYSVDDMRQRKQMQYNQLLWNVVSKGGFQFQDLIKYSKYLNKSHKSKVRPCTSVQQQRSTSAPASKRNKSSNTEETEPRPQTAHTGLRRTGLYSQNMIEDRTESKEQKNPKIVTDEQGHKKATQNGKEKLHDLPEESANGEPLLSMMLKMSAASSPVTDENKTKM